MNRRKKVVIVGAGPGGLTAAMLLAHRGLDVTVVEKGDHVGGRNGELRLGSYSFDIGPTFLHQKFTLDEMFAEVGRQLDDELDLVLLDPMTRLSWGDKSLDTSCRPEAMVEAIEKSFPGSSGGYERFMRDHEPKLRALYPCLQRPYHRLGTMLRPELLKAAKYVLTKDSVFSVLSQYFQDERLRLAFTFQSKYLGMSPWRCPALFSILAYTEYRFGVYHVQGGLCRISQRMAEIVESEGGEIRLGSPVEEVLVSGRTVTGVRLGSGEVLTADAVIMNADYGHAFTRLMNGKSVPDAVMRKKKFSCSTFMLYLGLDTIYRDEPHHHILFADDYHRNLEEIRGEREVSKDMSIYVRNSSVTDPHVAPDGHSALYVLVPTINQRHGADWESMQQGYRDLVLERIEQRTGMKDLRRHIVAEKVFTPKTWQDDGSIYLGATFNLSHTMDQLLYLRPHNKAQGLENCFLVGGGTHPGSGLPTIYESARISANLVCDEFAVPYRRVDLASSVL